MYRQEPVGICYIFVYFNFVTNIIFYPIFILFKCILYILLHILYTMPTQTTV